MSAEFDSHAASYRDEVNRAVSFAGTDVEFFAERKAQILVDVARRRVGDPAGLAVLDVGCGIGLVDGYLVDRFQSVAGVDVSASELAVARSEHPQVAYAISENGEVPHPSGSFDLVFASCVFHHVARGAQQDLANEMTRLVAPEGVVVVFEHNPWNPLTRLVVGRVSFDAGVKLVRPGELRSLLSGAGATLLATQYMTFFPWRGNLTTDVERRLGWLPLGAQYLVVARPSLP
jgi:SAM-dependent methyltransferase